jgi:hypothetical protein
MNGMGNGVGGVDQAIDFAWAGRLGLFGLFCVLVVLLALALLKKIAELIFDEIYKNLSIRVRALVVVISVVVSVGGIYMLLRMIPASVRASVDPLEIIKPEEEKPRLPARPDPSPEPEVPPPQQDPRPVPPAPPPPQPAVVGQTYLIQQFGQGNVYSFEGSVTGPHSGRLGENDTIVVDAARTPNGGQVPPGRYRVTGATDEDGGNRLIVNLTIRRVE